MTNRTETEVQAAKSLAGKWHILGPRGCLAVAADRVKADRVERIAADQRNRDWCDYCAQELRIIQLEREVERLEAGLAERTVHVTSPKGANADAPHNVHLDDDCPRLARAADAWPKDLGVALADAICSVCAGTATVHEDDDPHATRRALEDLDVEEVFGDDD